MRKTAKKPQLLGLGYNEPADGSPVRIEVGDLHFHVCCDCKLRHLVSIERSPYSRKEIISRWWRDQHGTEALRAAEHVTVKKEKKR